MTPSWYFSLNLQPLLLAPRKISNRPIFFRSLFFLRLIILYILLEISIYFWMFRKILNVWNNNNSYFYTWCVKMYSLYFGFQRANILTLDVLWSNSLSGFPKVCQSLPLCINSFKICIFYLFIYFFNLFSPVFKCCFLRNVLVKYNWTNVLSTHIGG